MTLSAESAVGCLSTCPRAHTGSASHLHLYNIAMRHVQKLDTVITVRLQTSWGSLLHMMRAHTASASHLHLYNIDVRHVQKHEYCDHNMPANLLGVSVAFDGIPTSHFGSRTDCLLDQHAFALYSDTSSYMREYGQASSWYNKDWAPPAKQHTKNSYSGWSKRATRGYQSDYEDRSRQCEDQKAIVV